MTKSDDTERLAADETFQEFVSSLLLLLAAEDPALTPVDLMASPNSERQLGYVAGFTAARAILTNAATVHSPKRQNIREKSEAQLVLENLNTEIKPHPAPSHV